MTATENRRPARPRRRDDPAQPVTPSPPAEPPVSEDEVLPPGQRDGDGFWFPAGRSTPGELFTPQQRRAQARQREVHRGRRPAAAEPVPRDDGDREARPAATTPARARSLTPPRPSV